MTCQRNCVLFLAVVLFALLIQPGARADAGPAAANASGEVNFQISCAPAVQKTFKEAVWTLHSFWYPEALKRGLPRSPKRSPAARWDIGASR